MGVAVLTSCVGITSPGGTFAVGVIPFDNVRAWLSAAGVSRTRRGITSLAALVPEVICPGTEGNMPCLAVIGVVDET